MAQIETDQTEAEKKLVLLQQIIETELDAGSKSGDSLKLWGRWLKGVTISLSAVVTIVLGLDLGDVGKGIALVLSTIVTAIGAWDAFTNYNQRSAQEYSNVNKLFSLYKDIKLYMEGNTNLKLEQYNQFKERYDSIHEEYLQERRTLTEDQNQEGTEKK
ncbi:SLATT domain-containing protein [Paenibacillus elgii]|nr:SLATT domain-containing protein [Paenibacillus elgii]